MINLSIHITLLVSGLLVNFITPAVFGVTRYGEFIAANAVVLLLHRVADIVIEPLVRYTDKAQVIFISLLFNSVFIIFFFVLDEMFSLGSSVLMLALLLSSSVLLSMHAMMQKSAILVFQLSMVALYVLLLYLAPKWGFTIEQVMEMSVIFPSSFAVAYVIISGAVLPTATELRLALGILKKSTGQALTVNAATTMLTHGLPVILSLTLGMRELGVFKIATSVVQSAITFFPIQIRSISHAMVQGAENLWPSLSRVVVFYFSLMGLMLLLAGIAEPRIAVYVQLAVVLPVFYWVLLAERYWVSRYEMKTLYTINLVVMLIVLLSATQTHTLHLALLLYATGLSLYGLRLAMIRMQEKRMAPILILCPVAVYFGAEVSIAYLAFAAALQLILNRLRFKDSRLVWRGI